MRFEVTHTDTFGGEANFAWAHSHEIEAPETISDRALVRRAKALCGLTGERSTSQAFGDVIRVDFRNLNQVIFIEPLIP